MFWIIAYIVSAIIVIGVLAFMSMTAPSGYEDESGFHYGEE